MNSRLFIFFLCWLFGSLLEAATLQAVEVKLKGGKTSLMFTLDQAITHKVFTLTNPNRVVVDFDDTNLSFNLKQLNLNNPLIKLVRSGSPKPNTLRLVFEVRDVVKLQANPWNRGKGVLHAFSLDLSANNYSPSPALPTNKTAYLTSVKPHENSLSIPKVVAVNVHHMPRVSLRDVIVVLDPGHGGKDPGASGPGHSQEKHITLAIAQKLKQIIDRQPGMRAVLTRTGDYYVGLRERLTIARKYSGDVFVAIHADAFINQQSNGASVFALSQSGATSEAARWLAEKENYSELGGVNLKDLDDRNGLVRTVLIDLSQTATIGSSLHMGERVLRHLNTMTTLHNHKVEQARFMVLKSPDIPSILIETGFISNPREEKNLTNAGYQTRLTQAIFQGIKGYFWDYPPHGTRVEALASNGSLHLVRLGESLPNIAAKYRTSVAALQAVNNLAGNQVHAGQRLIVPMS